MHHLVHDLEMYYHEYDFDEQEALYYQGLEDERAACWDAIFSLEFETYCRLFL